MINIYNYKKELIKSISNETGDIEIKQKSNLIIYLNYKSKGKEDDLKIEFLAYERTIDDFYPIQIENGTNLEDKILIFNEAKKYRTELKEFPNEEGLKLLFTFEGDDLSELGEIDVYLIPKSSQY